MAATKKISLTTSLKTPTIFQQLRAKPASLANSISLKTPTVVLAQAVREGRPHDAGNAAQEDAHEDAHEGQVTMDGEALSIGELELRQVDYSEAL